jgi:hypothetical protein
MLLWVKRVTLASVVFLVVIQIFRPAISNPPVDPKREIHASLAVEPAVATVLTRACNDCHSNRTVWPWYSHVAPVSWLVVSDVNRGRKALNFSEWTGYPAEDQQKQLSEICKEVSEGEMPNLAYTLSEFWHNSRSTIRYKISGGMICCPRRLRPDSQTKSNMGHR